MKTPPITILLIMASLAIAQEPVYKSDLPTPATPTPAPVAIPALIPNNPDPSHWDHRSYLWDGPKNPILKVETAVGPYTLPAGTRVTVIGQLIDGKLIIGTKNAETSVDRSILDLSAPAPTPGAVEQIPSGAKNRILCISCRAGTLPVLNELKQAGYTITMWKAGGIGDETTPEQALQGYDILADIGYLKPPSPAPQFLSAAHAAGLIVVQEPPSSMEMPPPDVEHPQLAVKREGKTIYIIHGWTGKVLNDPAEVNKLVECILAAQAGS